MSSFIIHEISLSEITTVASFCTERDAYLQARESWLQEQLPNGLTINIALVPKGDITNNLLIYNEEYVIVGMIEHAPANRTPYPVESDPEVEVIHCLWVVPEFKGLGVGTSLIKAAISWCRKNRRHGVTVVCYSGPRYSYGHMPLSYFARFGFYRCDSDGMRQLAYLPLKPGPAPHLRSLPAIQPADPLDESLAITVFYHEQCPASLWSMVDISTRIQIYPSVKLVTIDTSKQPAPPIMLGLLINGELVWDGLVLFSVVERELEKRKISKADT